MNKGLLLTIGGAAIYGIMRGLDIKENIGVTYDGLEGLGLESLTKGWVKPRFEVTNTSKTSLRVSNMVIGLGSGTGKADFKPSFITQPISFDLKSGTQSIIKPKLEITPAVLASLLGPTAAIKVSLSISGIPTTQVVPIAKDVAAMGDKLKSILNLLKAIK